jgi:hypothetical protein
MFGDAAQISGRRQEIIARPLGPVYDRPVHNSPLPEHHGSPEMMLAANPENE